MKTTHCATKPKQPLTAYNLFFQLERKRILQGMNDFPITRAEVNAAIEEHQVKEGKRLHRKSHGKIGFNELSRMVSRRWKDLDNSTREMIEWFAKMGKKEYRKKLAQWKQSDEYKESQEYKQKHESQQQKKELNLLTVSLCGSQQEPIGTREQTIQNDSTIQGFKETSQGLGNSVSEINFFQSSVNGPTQHNLILRLHQQQLSEREFNLTEYPARSFDCPWPALDVTNASPEYHEPDDSPLSMGTFQWDHFDQDSNLDPIPISPEFDSMSTHLYTKANDLLNLASIF